MVGGVGGFCLRTAAAQPQQAAGKDVAELAEVGWEVGVGGVAAHPL